MTQEPKRYLITAALPYANGPIHIGHLAGVYVPADIYVRYLRAMGRDVAFVCGSDEHGVPVTIRAEQEGITVQEVVDKYHNLFKQSFADFGISFDIYSRTSNPIHHETAQDFFKNLYDKGLFEEKTEEQYYDEVKGRFLQDRYIRGTCPNCGNPDAQGDQCEKCGTALSPNELINPRSAYSNATPTLRPTKNWYLPLQDYAEWLREWIVEGHKDDWKTNVLGQCKSWIEDGLRPRAMTRDLDWGIDVPLEGLAGKKLYVWFEAPIGYISATKELTPDWEKYWKSADTKLVHFIGKDNIVFHCIIFPAMLKAYGDFILPENVPANEFMNLEGDKISTSRNWAVWLHEYLQDFPAKQDALRYALTANMPETKDNDFTWADFYTKYNSELVGILGNFINRVVVLTEKYFGGITPAVGKLQEIDQTLITTIAEAPEKIAQSLEQYRFREALAYYMDVARAGNKYMQDNAPWSLHKAGFEENKERIATILHISLQLVANLAVLGEPFLPFTAGKIRTMLGLPTTTWAQGGSMDLVKEGQTVQNTGLLFDKIEEASIEAQVGKLEATKKAREENATENKQEPAKEEKKTLVPLKPEIDYTDFEKIDIRVATVLTAEKVKGADKLLQLTLDTGIDTRTVVSGIALQYAPEDLVGKQVCLLANLAPRKLRGIMSQGMILTAETPEGTLRLIAPHEVVTNGSVVK
ncbi:MAG: methionine--tRNA ligase [Bacteroidetes bacterium]|nr:MAG: methionine--tRNA ligase [Bacteroidota bacterium]